LFHAPAQAHDDPAQTAPGLFLQADALSFLQVDGHADFLAVSLIVDGNKPMMTANHFRTNQTCKLMPCALTDSGRTSGIVRSITLRQSITRIQEDPNSSRWEMVMRAIILFLVVILTGIGRGRARDAGLKKWRDDKGIWHFGDSRPTAPDAATNSAADAYRRGDYNAAFSEYMVWAKQGDPKSADHDRVDVPARRGYDAEPEQRHRVVAARRPCRATPKPNSNYR
jgi:hypothetical protein